MKIKQILFNKVFIASIMGVSSISLMGLVSFSHFNSAKLNSFNTAQSGIGICFQRVTQSFTALMIGDLKSNYISKNFNSMTSECFEDVEQATKGLVESSHIALKTLNSLRSDLHWFDNQVSRILDLKKNQELDLSQSNLVSKYQNLEILRTQFEEELLTQKKKLQELGELAFYASAIAQLLLLLGGISLFLKSKLDSVASRRIESLLQGFEQDIDVDKDKIFYALEHEKLIPIQLTNYFKEKIDDLENQVHSAEASLLKLAQIPSNEVYAIDASVVGTGLDTKLDEEKKSSNSLKEEQRSEKVDFSKNLNFALKNTLKSAVEKNISLETDIEDEFQVYSQSDALGQFLQSLLNFSISKASEVNSDSIVLKTKGLGAIASFIIEFDQAVLAQEEIEYINLKSNTSNNIDLTLIRELTKEANSSVELVQKFNKETGKVTHRLELSFEKVANAEKKINIVKGSKAKIREYFDQQLSH